MWNRLLTPDAVKWMASRSFEDPIKIYAFFNFLEDRLIDYDEIINLVKEWHSFKDYTVVSKAIYYVGEDNASRFILFMDYHSMKHLKGEFLK